MGDKVTLKVDERQVHGKKVAKLRKEGLVPGIVYGAGMEPVSIQASAGEVAKVLSAAGQHTPVHLTGKKRQIAMIKEVDRHPVKHNIRHIAFHAVKADEPVIAEIPIKLVGVGESPAEKAGLVVLQSLEKIEIKALPMSLPDVLEVSIAELEEAGQRVSVGDIELPEDTELVEHDDGREGTEDDDVTVKDLVIASVYEPSALQAANEAAAGDAEADDVEEVAAENGGEEADAAGEDDSDQAKSSDDNN